MTMVTMQTILSSYLETVLSAGSDDGDASDAPFLSGKKKIEDVMSLRHTAAGEKLTPAASPSSPSWENVFYGETDLHLIEPTFRPSRTRLLGVSDGCVYTRVCRACHAE